MQIFGCGVTVFVDWGHVANRERDGVGGHVGLSAPVHAKTICLAVEAGPKNTKRQL